MSVIKMLAKSISDKIAAGEVVEKPLSIVKELVENAIDANASAISINISGGGIKEVCVTDNGTGIGSDYVKLAFEKHATSKIFSENDLHYISTQGFRGEALSSISAVSVVEMKTKQKEEELGTHIHISGGRLDYINPAGLPDGTMMCISNLFFNVPARRKFLKREAQEAAYISDLVSRYILGFPEISFHYTSQGKTFYHSPGDGDMQSAIYSVYGSDILDNISYVEYEANDIKVSGYVSRPGTVMKNRRAGSVFVNHRYVRSTGLHDMVKSAYGETFVKGEFPFFALNIDVPASSVDVNVHPNKLQVRFADTATVEYVIKEAVSQACKKIYGSVNIDVSAKLNTKRSSIEMHAPSGFTQAEFFSGFSTPTLLKEEQYLPKRTYHYETDTDNHIVKDMQEESVQRNAPPISYQLIGCFDNTYILIEQGTNLLIIDQHAAHERLLYEQFKSSCNTISQQLLTPYVMTVSHQQKNVIDENIHIFNELGFDIQPFGMLEYKIDAVPSIVYSASVHELLNDALNEMRSGDDIILKRECIIKTACRSAVKAGDKLGDEELKSLVDSFLKTNTIPTCPHGRPVISLITKKQIEKSFKRIV